MSWDPVKDANIDTLTSRTSFKSKRRPRLAIATICVGTVFLFLIWIDILRMFSVHSEYSSTNKVSTKSIVKKVTGLYGDGAWYKSDVAKDLTFTRLQRAVDIHKKHAKLHQHEQLVLSVPLFGSRINNEYTKIGNLLQENIKELSHKGRNETRWLFWHDADTVVLNKMVSLDTFVTDADENVNLLYTKDFNGLNAGVLFFRVSEWTTLLLSYILAIAQPDGMEPWDFWEQGALSQALKLDYFAKAALEIPKDWMNRYPYLEWNDTNSSFHNHVRPGTFQVHLAGPDKYKTGWFDYFLDVAEGSDATFHNQSEADALQQEIKGFWRKYKSDLSKA